MQNHDLIQFDRTSVMYDSRKHKNIERRLSLSSSTILTLVMTVISVSSVFAGPMLDCNNNFVADNIDISSGTSLDCNSNGMPDECEFVDDSVTKLTADDAAAGDNFSLGVSVSGDTAVIGAPFDDNSGFNSGSAYVFREVGGVWQQIAKLTADDAAELDNFGRGGVSISGDTAVIGAQGDDDGGSNSGSAYVFREVGGVWQQIAKLTANDAAELDNFGVSVSVNGDIAVISSIGDDDGGSDSGSAYVFREVGGTWQQIAKLTANDAVEDARFGISVSLSGDTAIIGADLDDDGGSNSGSAYVFREVGGIWQQIAKLTANDAAVSDFFGNSVSLSGDSAVIGAFANDDSGIDSGSAYVFREAGGVWQQIAKLTANDAAGGARFGNSVSISGDTATIGAFTDDDGGIDTGSAYVFRELGGVWQQIAKLTANDAAESDFFGNSVSISGDTVTIGAQGDDDGGSDSGSAYILRSGCPIGVCGDGVTDTGEECDDGNADNTDGCLDTCVAATCGDGFVQAGVEECDDGVGNSDTTPDACRTDCTNPVCGDGVTDSGEDCDDGAGNSDVLPDACRTDCSAPSCGDGVTDSGEECDDGAANANEPDACRTNCQLPECGDGIVDNGEACDDAGSSATCDDDCTLPICGDGVVNPEAGEECDDGGISVACDGDCTLPVCGDGNLNLIAGEECDDGNTDDGDGCSATCIRDGAAPVPAVSTWGMILLCILLAIGVGCKVRRPTRV